MTFSKRMELRLSESDKATLQRVAKAAGMSSSEYLRSVIRTNEHQQLANK